jgi:hypothetical protein
MKPLFLADWAYINRLFRAAMWLMAVALAGVIIAFASPHASHKRAATHTATPAQMNSQAAVGGPVPARK